MNLFRVTAYDDHEFFVLAETFDGAAQVLVNAGATFGAYTIADVVKIEGLGTPMQRNESAFEQAELKPAVPIKKSVTPDWIVCLDDGKKFKSLRRHLSVLGMTPAAYRAKWGLPADYPLVAANYSAKRSELAKANRLGRA